MLRYLTAGESHGKGLTLIIDGFPSNVPVCADKINEALRSRQKGYGRGGRQKIESDSAEITAGVRGGKTLGSPIAIFIQNRDYENWKEIMSSGPLTARPVKYSVPRPGHADLAGATRFGHEDIRNVLERASARETAARVAAGAVCSQLLEVFGVEVFGYVTEIGGVSVKNKTHSVAEAKKECLRVDAASKAELRTTDLRAARDMKKLIGCAASAGDTLGGRVRIISSSLPAGLGSYTQWDAKLDAKLAMALISVQAFKGVEFGAGFSASGLPGSGFHDAICRRGGKITRRTNNAGGFEGGMTNGMPLDVTAFVKPISTVKKGIDSVDTVTGKATKTIYERSDVCAVPAASVVAQSVVECEIAGAIIEKFGSGDIRDIARNFNSYAGRGGLKARV